MKIFNLFLILIMLVCYSGICGSSSTLASPVELKTESCHKMDNNQASHTNNKLLQNFNQKGSASLTCCFDSLINSVDDNYVSDFVTLEPTAFISDDILTKDNLIIKNMSLRGHSPPDLQVLNSTFLI